VSVVRVTEDDERYEAMSQGFNQRWLAKPDSIALVYSTDDVVAVVEEAVANGQRISVRSGGHCYENFVCNDEVKVIIDVSGLDQVHQDERGFCLGAGATNWRLCTHLYRPFGLAVPGGSCYSVGAGGHISAGGFGLLSRQFGLTVDYLQAVEVVVVDANGNAEAVIADRDDEKGSDLKELFWAHTGGGGGNFGVITRYWMRSDLPCPPKNVWLSGAQFSWEKLGENGFKQLVRNFGKFFVKHAKRDDPYKDLFAILKLTHVSNGKLGLVVQLDATKKGSAQKLALFYNAILDGIGAEAEHFTLQVGVFGGIQDDHVLVGLRR
jgi:hypothetical protein